MRCQLATKHKSKARLCPHDTHSNYLVRATPGKLEGCKATQCEEGPLLASSWTFMVLSITEHTTYHIFPRNHSYQSLWSFPGEERRKVSEAQSSNALYLTTCFLVVQRGRPVSQTLILPTNDSWPIPIQVESKTLP